MLDGRPGSCGDQESAEFVAVQSDGVRFAVQAGAADVRGRGMVQEFFLDRVPVEPADRAQPAGDGRAGPAALFQVAGEQFDVGGGPRAAAGTGSGTRW
jgi:hypothetical protein